MAATQIQITSVFGTVHGIFDINWVVTNCNDGVDFFNIQFSSNGGSTYTTLATVGCGTTTFAWDTNALTNGNNYQIRVFLDSDIGVNGVSEIFTLLNESHVVVGTGGIKTRFLRRDVPVDTGLAFGTQRQEGNVSNLVIQEKSLVYEEEKKGL